MGISSPGIGSNLDVNGIVSKLMSVEQQPLTMLQTQEASYQAKLSGFGTLKGVLSSFQTAVAGLSDVSKFQGVLASAADPTVATLSGNSTAATGSYALTVNQLAQSQKLVAAGTASQSTPIGSGVISIDFGTIAGGTLSNGTYTGATFTSAGAGVKNITIDASNNSLTGIRDAINAANAGVTASIVNDGSGTPYRLTLTSTQTGAASSMKISVADTAPDTGLSALLNNDPAGSQAMTQTAAAQNAQLTIDGIAVSKPSNTISDTLTGITLNLLKTNVGAPTTLTVARDTASVTTAVTSFVSAFNNISQTLAASSAYDASTNTAAILNGESTVRTMQSQINNILTTPLAGGASAFSLLSDVGVSLQKDGTLAVDNTKLNTALTSNFNGFAGLFAATGTASDSLITYSGASSNTVAGSYAVNVTRLATQGTTQATAAAGLTIDGTNNTLSVKLNGVTSSVTLNQKTYASANDLAAELQSEINGNAAFAAAGSSVQVTQTGGVLKITSGLYGSVSNINITETGTPNLHFDTSGANVQAGLDVAGSINGATATGSGQLLTGATSDPSSGLGIVVTGGLGARGTINYSQGYAYQFNQMATAMLSSTGAMAARTDGLNASIKSTQQDEANMNVSLAATEARYRAQFTALDVAISSMNSTTAFLTQQLAQISAQTPK